MNQEAEKHAATMHAPKGENEAAELFLVLDKFTQALDTHLGIAKEIRKIADVYKAVYAKGEAAMNRFDNEIYEAETDGCNHNIYFSLWSTPEKLDEMERREEQMQETYMNLLFELISMYVSKSTEEDMKFHYNPN